MFRKLVCLAGFLTLVCPSFAMEEAAIEYDADTYIQSGGITHSEIFSQSNRKENPLTSTAAVDVVKITDENRRSATSLADVLKTIPGVSTFDQGSLGDMSSVRIRGWNKIRMNMDGVRIDNPSFAGAYVNNLMPTSLDRIEVIKGPSGSVQGNKAQGGTISLFTQKGEKGIQGGVTSGFGNNNTFKEEYWISGATTNENQSDYFFSLSALKTNGGSDTTGNLNSWNDEYRNMTLVSNVGQKLLKGKAEVRNTLRYIDWRKNVGVSDSDTGYPNYSPKVVYDPDSYSNGRDIIESLSFAHAPNDFYDYYVQFGLYSMTSNNYDTKDRFDYFNGNTRNNVTNDRVSLTTQHNFKLPYYNTLSVAYNLEHNKFKQDNFYDSIYGASILPVSKGFTVQELFFNDTYNYKDKVIVKGGTGLSFSPWGFYATPDLSGALVLPTFKIKDAYTKLRANAGYSIDYPTPYQTAGISGYGGYRSIVGNPNLKPERAFSYDIGTTQSFMNEKVVLEGSYFHNNYDNLITQNFSRYGAQFFNTDHALTQGLEGSIKLKLKYNLDFMANYTYTLTDRKDGAPIAGVPPHTFNFRLGYTPNDKYNAYIKATSFSRMLYTTYPNDRYVNSFIDLGAGGSVKLLSAKNFDLYLWGSLNNILNKRYELYHGHEKPGINFLAGIEIKFGKVPNL